MRSDSQKKPFIIDNTPILIIFILLTVATVMLFGQVIYCDFTNYDDTTYVTINRHIQNGLTLAGIRWAFTAGYAENWHPMTWISHMLDVQFFGLNPGWHHFNNLLFHLANTLLLFYLLQRMTKAPWRSAFVAALFAFHPLHVESVAWVAERKDVLSTFFWMLTIGAYSFYVERPGLRRYLLILVFFVLGLMAKPMLVTLPFVLLLLDFWPLNRFRERYSDQDIRTLSNINVSRDDTGRGKLKKKPTDEKKVIKPSSEKYSWASVLPLLREKIPFFALSAVSSLVTYIVQHKGGAVQSIEVYPLTVRIANAFVSYITYTGKTIWPNSLAVFYPYQWKWPLWQVSGAVLIFIAITLMVVRVSRKYPYLSVGWLWYIGTLVPVIGIVQVGMQARADRYTYIPLIGLFIMAAWGVPELMKTWRHRKTVLLASSATSLSFLFIIAWTQVGYWQNNITLFNHALNVTDDNYIAYYSLGESYSVLGDHKKAIDYYDKAIEIKANFAMAYYNRGYAYASLGNRVKAIQDYTKSIELEPDSAEVYVNRGLVYSDEGDHRLAIEDYSKAISINSTYANSYYDRGNEYVTLGNNREAIEDYNKAIEINPKFAHAYANRGIAYRKLGNPNRAIEDYDKAIEIYPRYAAAYANRGVAYKSLGNETQALEDMKAAARLGDVNAQNLLRKSGINWQR